MYEWKRFDKLNNGINISISNINNRFNYFKNNTIHKNNKNIYSLFDNKIRNNNNQRNKLFFDSSNYLKNKTKNFNKLNNDIYNLNSFLKNRNTFDNNSKKGILYKNVFIGQKNNNKINQKIKYLKEEINSNKNFFDFKIFEYRRKKNCPKKSNLTNLTIKKNKSFESKKILSFDKYIKTNKNLKPFNFVKKSKIFYFRNPNNNLYNNFKTINDNFYNNNNNLIFTQNNTNNYFFINYNNFKKENPKPFFNINANKQNEENSIDINNIDDSSILNN